jgi:hypothetical protein
MSLTKLSLARNKSSKILNYKNAYFDVAFKSVKKVAKKSTLKYLPQNRQGEKLVFQRSLFFSKVFGLYLFLYETV